RVKNEKVELINELLMYQRNLAQIKKYQAQQNKLVTKAERRDFYMSILRSNAVTTASTVVSSAVATTSESFPTVVIFTTASVATPTTRVTRSSKGVVIEFSSPISVNIPSISKKDKEKGKMTKHEQPSKEKVLEQMSAQLARDVEAKFD
nr:hypothetical protein [Tanacetum cinerariifolium]